MTRLSILLTAILLLVMAVSLRATGRGERPRLTSVEDVLRRVLDLQGEAVDLSSRELLRSSLLRAKTVEAGVEARTWRFWESADRADRADRAWHEAMRAGWIHVKATQQRRGELAADWERALVLSEGRLREARSRAGRLGERDALAALAAAESSFALARSWAAQGRLEPATAAAQRSVEHLDRFEIAWDEAHTRFDEAGNRRRWASWVATTLTASRQQRDVAIIVDKLRRRVEVYERGERVAAFEAELGSGGLEAKLRAGDKATPEGRYEVTERRDRGATRYYKALMLDYPNAEDRRRFKAAQKRGEIPRGVGIGSLIEIHGRGGQGLDWTDGCVALRDADMDRVFALARVGTPVTIVGTVP